MSFMTNVKEQSIFNDALSHFNQKNYQQSFDLLEVFKQENNVNDLVGASFDLSFFEISVHFNVGRSGSPSYYQSAITLARSLLKQCYATTEQRDAVQPIQFSRVWGILAECHASLDDTKNAVEAFENCLKYEDGEMNAPIYLKLLILYSKSQMPTEARALSTKLLQWENFITPTHFVLLNLAIHEQDKDQAIKEIECLEARFESLENWQHRRLITKTLDISEFDRAEQQINNSRQLSGDSNNYSYEYATILFERKEYQQVIDVLRSDDVINNERFTAHLLARTYEKLGRYDEAYHAFSRSAELQELEATEFKQQDKQINYATRYQDIDFDTLAKRQIDSVTADEDINTPVFMLGFPRSGTTLLDTILDTQPLLDTLSERPTISAVIRYMETELSKNYPADVPVLTTQEVERLRAVYFGTAKLYAPGSEAFMSRSENRYIVDKMPLNTLHIPLILTLFPRAKFIFSLRHPMDCVFSSFQQNLLLNSEMSFLSTLDICTARYNEVIRHFERCQSAFQLDLIFIKYEDLISNLEREAKKVFDFINLQKVDESYLEFDKIASNKIFNTPSKDQVTQGLYRSSMYKWKHYEQYLEDHLDSLSGYIGKFDY